MASRFLYPVALNVRGKRCIVVGAGPVGNRKAHALREAGAEVVQLSLEATGPFQPQQLQDAFLVIAATNDHTVNAAIAQAARERHVLLNMASPGDEKDTGDFATMAPVRRGDLLFGITTGGAGPALAAQLRLELERRYPASWADYVALLADCRKLTRSPDVLRQLVHNTTIRARALDGDSAGAREEAMRCLS